MPPAFRNQSSVISGIEELSRGSFGADRIWNKIGVENQSKIVNAITKSVVNYDNILNSNRDEAGKAIIDLFSRGVSD